MNKTLRQAFEEAEKKELEALPTEDRIIRPYSQEFTKAMDELLHPKNETHVRKKKIKWPALIAAIIVTVIFCAGAVSGRNLSDLFTEGGIIYGMHFGDEEYDAEKVLSEGCTEQLEYNGKDLKMTFLTYTGSDANGCGYDIMVYIDGVQQTFTAEYNGEKAENVTRFPMTVNAGEAEKVELSLKPNIGKKGEEKDLFVVMQYDTELTYTPQCDTPYKEISPCHDFDDSGKTCIKCGMNKMKLYECDGAPAFSVQTVGHATITMKKDAPARTEVAESFSGMEVSPMHELLLKTYEYEDIRGNSYSDYDDSVLAGLRFDLYKDIEEHIYKENGVLLSTNKIYTTAKTEDEFTFTFHGQSGKYRVSLYNGTELLTPFDGKAYADIEVSHGNQVDLNVKLDTTKFDKGNNFVYALYQNLDGTTECAGIYGQLVVATVVVE